jgi:hypothetical protein
MNAYQKTTIIVVIFLLPLLLLFMKAMGYAGVWIVGAAGAGLAMMLVYALRNAQDE